MKSSQEIDLPVAAALSPLSYAQEGIWFLSRLEEESHAYHMHGLFEVAGELDHDALLASIDTIVERHQILRCNVRILQGKPFLVESRNRASAEIVELDGDCGFAPESPLWRRVHEELGKPFDLQNESLVRVRLYHYPSGHSFLFVNMHHLISDGWSLSVFKKELKSLYDQLAAGGSPALRALPFQYQDFVQHERDGKQQAKMLEGLSYWEEKLKDVSFSAFPIRQNSAPKANGAGKLHRFRIAEPLARKAKEFSRQSNQTLYLTLLSAFQSLLAKYTGESDIAVGTSVANRNDPKWDDLIGLFVNTVVVRSTIPKEATFLEVCRDLKRTIAEGSDFQGVPYGKVIERMRSRTPQRRDLGMETMFVYQSQNPGSLSLRGMSIEEIEIHNGSAKFGFTMTLIPGQGTISGTIEYDSGKYEEWLIDSICRNYMAFLENLIAQPSAPIEDVPCVDEEERLWMLDQGKAIHAKPQLRHETLGDAFKDVAIRYPNRIAVECGERALSYAELDGWADRVAACLPASSSGSNLVGICVHRSVEMIVSILAVLKSGMGYVPIDPDYTPRDRIGELIRDSGAGLVIAERAIDFDDGRIRRLNIDEPLPRQDAVVHRGQGENEAGSGIAYLIYTSGSTGKPKGVLIRHTSVISLFEATRERFGFSCEDVWTLFHSYSFDFSVWEIFGALLHGGKLVVPTLDTVRSPQEFSRYLIEKKVTFLNQTPSAFGTLLKWLDLFPGLAFPDLRFIVFGGEALKFSSLKGWYEKRYSPAARLVNMYGITEATVHSSIFPIGPDDAFQCGASLIGRPLPHVSFFILDEKKCLLPKGATGELYLGGISVSPGYLNRRKETEERFSFHSFPGLGEQWIYRTGDRVRWTGTGVLEYLGRIDRQVKVRGYRIELAEIEAALGDFPGIETAKVVADAGEDGSSLTAYYSSRGSQGGVDLHRLKGFLGTRLQSYMIPGYYRQVDEWPLTKNGKIDAKRLSELPDGKAEAGDTGNTLTESQFELSRIWSELLGVSNIHSHSDFFGLGGHSLLAAQLTGLVRQRMKRCISARQVFDFPVLRDMAMELERCDIVTGKDEVPDEEILI